MRGKLSRSGKLEIGDYSFLRRIRSPKQFDLFEIPNYVLSAILIQKIVEKVIRSVKLYDPVKVAERWKRGVFRLSLPPVVSLKILLKGLGYGDEEIANMLKNPSEGILKISSGRL